MESLGNKLEALRKGAKLRPEIAALMFRHNEELNRKLAEDGVLGIGDRFPGFALRDHQGTLVRSADLLANGPLVVSMFRGTWCSYCDAELQSLNAIYPDVRKLGAELVLISPQSPESAAEYLSAHPVPFRILVDDDAGFAAALGLGYGFPEYLENLYRNVFKIDLLNINAGGLWRLPIPGRFVVDEGEMIVDVEYNPDFRYRPDPADLLALLSEMQSGVGFAGIARPVCPRQ
jgi:peroxiredoxin